MLNASISTILKELIVEILRQDKVLTWIVIFLTREVWMSDQGGGLVCDFQTMVYNVSLGLYRIQ